MSISIYPSAARGHLDHGWLDTRHSFSFGHWYQPDRMGFHSLRVINEDRIAAQSGFGKHFHDNMEILTYVYAGELSHQDNTGGGGVIRRGDVQKMSAGTGIIHSEHNRHATDDCELLQIWIIPNQFNVKPAYDQKHFDEAARRDRLCLLASPEGRDGSFPMYQDANIFASVLSAGRALELPLADGRHGWIQVVRGHATVGGVPVTAGDAAIIEGEARVAIEAVEECEFLAFDLA